MANKSELINIMNDLIKKSGNGELIQMIPITRMDLMNNERLCELLVDYLSDIHMVVGFDENYNETEIGKLLSKMIDFITLTNEMLE